MKTNYVLEKEDEADRLDYQSSFPRYNFKKEFRDFFPSSGESILDAGSGSGLVLSYLAAKYPNSKFTGVDFSQERVFGACSKYKDLKNLKFQREDLRKISFPEKSFNHAISRYVVEHVPKADVQQVFNEVFKAIKPGGTFHCVDFDGPMFNVFPQTKLMQTVFKAMNDDPSLDLWVGRKIPHYCTEAGFEILDWRIETIECKGEYLGHELSLLPDKFDRISSWINDITGISDAGTRFKKDYLNTLNSPGTTLFYNKFIVRARRPITHLKAV